MTNSADAPTPSPPSEGDGVAALPLPEDVAAPLRPMTRRARREEVGKASKTGRDLPMAIGVGAALLALLMLGIFVWPPLFVALGAAVCVIGVWEVSRALQAHTGVPVPLLPLAVGAAAMPIAASYGGPSALGVAATAAVLLVTLWNALEGRASSLRSIGYSLLTLAWVPLLASFAFLLFAEEDGPLLLFSLLLLVIANDTFGYIFGAWLGKHPMAPRVSPKKSWEGFAGSVGGAMVVGVLLCLFVLELPWWVGLVLAAATALAATAGDLAESMVKRELGVKDMSNLLPGHGGMMDRLDSMLFAVPIGYIVTTLSVGALA